MANRGRLRPVDAVLPEYLENPFSETRMEIHAPSVPSRLRLVFPVPPGLALPCASPAAFFPFGLLLHGAYQNCFLR